MNYDLEKKIVELVNEMFTEYDVYLEKNYYQKIEFRIYSESIIKSIMTKLKFKDIGSIQDFPTALPQPESIDGYDIANNYDSFQRIAVSEKVNGILLYTGSSYFYSCVFLVDTEYLKKFSKTVKPILQQDSGSRLFKNVDFKCKKREYIEIAEPTSSDRMMIADVTKKKIKKENLVFDEGSTIFEVMQDIFNFFKADTSKLYDKMQIAYKRGIIIYGDPGNGKSAMIREIIRRVPDITKVIINPNVENVTKILSTLIDSLDGKKAIIVIEDIDSLITSRNRSEFLNILDGVDIKSGVYFIGTTNYPEQIDPAFMNRSGRFDRTYKINNPGEATRRAFFESRQIGELLSEYKVYKDDSKPDTDEAIVELFVKYTDDIPMASLKEIMTSTQYLLASNNEMSVEEAVEKVYTDITKTKSDHVAAHDSYNRSREVRRGGSRGVGVVSSRDDFY